MDDSTISLYKRMKDIHENIYSDELGGSTFYKCFLMAYLFRECNYKNYVEIGVYRGKSLFTVSVAVQANNGQAYGIDPYRSSSLIELDAKSTVQQIIEKAASTIDFDELFQEVNRFANDFGFESTVNLMRQTSDEAVHNLIDENLTIDMLHIDGNHDKVFVNVDASNYIPLVREGGIIVFDDIDWPSVRSVYYKEKKKSLSLYETDTFGVLVKTEKNKNNAEQLQQLFSVLQAGLKAYSMISDLWNPLDLLIIDDIFPCPISAFRFEEFKQLLSAFDNTRVYCTGTALHLITKDTNHEIIRAFQEKYPSFSNKIVEWQGFDVEHSVQAKLGYFCFLNNVYRSLETIEQQRIPFVFELYPGGGFALGNDESDRMLRRVTCSPYFRRVIVSQKITRDYLVENRFCDASKIETVFGVVTPSERFRDFNDNSVRYGIDKDRLDICFAAMRYTPLGEDKGYDIFIQVAKELCKKHDNIYFHVVGSFDETVIDVSDIREHISFYGVRPMDWFDSFYQDKDIILSPNTHGKMRHGAFDGFPTGCCIDAGLREVAIFCTDDLHQNDGYFVDKAEMMIVEHNVADIVHKIDYYYQCPDELRRMSTRGRAKIKQLYSLEAQLEPRIQILKQEIEKSDVNTQIVAR